MCILSAPVQFHNEQTNNRGVLNIFTFVIRIFRVFHLENKLKFIHWSHILLLQVLGMDWNSSCKGTLKIFMLWNYYCGVFVSIRRVLFEHFCESVDRVFQL